MMMLEVDHLSLSFRRYAGLLRRTDVVALQDVSAKLAAGEVLGVIGGSGAGKSLLAHAVLGILPSNAETHGEVRFMGQVLTPERLKRLRGRRMALVPQSITALDPLARIGRQVTWAAVRAGVEKEAASDLAASALHRFGLDDRASRAFPHQLSGGMARRALMAAATVGQADLLIVDEPTTGLDPENVATVMAYLRAWADAGKAVVLITHDLAAVLPVADRITVLREGVSIETAPARAFAGKGLALKTAYARALWLALPQNDFSGGKARLAA
jgi:peptide/nickel transport system ATP-binding protein